MSLQGHGTVFGLTGESSKDVYGAPIALDILFYFYARIAVIL